MSSHRIHSARRAVQGWLLCAALALAAGDTQAAGAVLVLNNPTDPPYTTDKGDGLLDRVVGEAFRRAGVTLKLVKLPAERGLIDANAGIDDGDLSRIAGLDKTYPNLVRVPEKIFDLEFVALTRKARAHHVNWRSLEPLSVGYIKGWKIFEQSLTPKTAAITTDTPEQLMEMLGRGRVDVALYSRWMGLAMAHQMRIGDVHVIEPPLATREMFVYLHRRHAALAPKIAEALRALKREGVYDRIQHEKLDPLREASAR